VVSAACAALSFLPKKQCACRSAGKPDDKRMVGHCWVPCLKIVADAGKDAKSITLTTVILLHPKGTTRLGLPACRREPDAGMLVMHRRRAGVQGYEQVVLSI
jgi:hypothetical protein